MKLWGARFAASPAPELTALSRAEERQFDLLRYDIEGSRAHIRELVRAGILTAAEFRLVEDALAEIGRRYASGDAQPGPSDEDVHSLVERLAVERLGPLAGKVRAGRSRNDQAANNLRLYLRDQARRIHDLLLEVIAALTGQARRHTRTLAPGLTHLQPAQPVVFAHQLLAHAHSLARDAGRLRDWDERADWCPLGAAALAGSPFAVHPEECARFLGYVRAFDNSIDAVSSRDHVAEFLFVAAMIGVDLSRLAEEICLWVSHQFRWADLADSHATGSSIMPQKKNPDIAELARGKAGRLVGNLGGLMATLKSLPLAYDRDLGEDKHAAMDSVDTLVLVLPAMAGLVTTLRFHEERMRQDATARYALATEIADWLAASRVPFSEAHEITGRLVQVCEQRGCDLADLDAECLRNVDGRLGPELLDILSPESAVARRRGHGATAPERVEEQLAELEHAVQDWRRWSGHYSGLRT
jgi:argininosuccinate lyase